jgi:hypothetical protein
LTNPTSFEIIPASGGWRVHYLDTATSGAKGKIILWSLALPEIDDAYNVIAKARAYASTAPVVLPRRFYLAS